MAMFISMPHTYRKRRKFFICRGLAVYCQTLTKNNILYRKNREVTRSIPKHIALRKKHLLHCALENKGLRDFMLFFRSWWLSTARQTVQTSVLMCSKSPLPLSSWSCYSNFPCQKIVTEKQLFSIVYKMHFSNTRANTSKSSAFSLEISNLGTAELWWPSSEEKHEKNKAPQLLLSSLQSSRT